MGRKRLEKNRLLPMGVRCREGYYTFKNPLDGREYGLGRDKRRAIQEAKQALRGFAPKPWTGEELQTAEHVRTAAVQLDETCGIYVLLLDERLLYVGQSTNVRMRVAVHLTQGIIQFNRCHIIPCDIGSLDAMEAAYISALQPEFNKVRYLKKTTVWTGGESEGIGETWASY